MKNLDCSKKQKSARALMVLYLWVFVFIFGCAAAKPEQAAAQRQFTVHLREVFDAKVSLIPFAGQRAVYSKPIEEVFGVKEGETATISVPARYLPGEFLLRLDYRKKKTDKPYPAERVVFINKQDIEITVNPPYINNDDKTKFNKGEKENTVYSVFMKENREKRLPLDLLRQLLLEYDRSEAKFYAQAVREFKQRRIEYNRWLNNQVGKYRELYVSKLFQFQHLPEVAWSGAEEERLKSILENYFEGIDFSDPLIIGSRELSRFMDNYMRLYGMLAKSKELRDSLFTRAGRAACEKASLGHPEVCGWMVDYFYKGYESAGIEDGIIMLGEYAKDSDCLVSKKKQILSRIKSIEELAPGRLAPDFTASDSQGDLFEFHAWQPRQQYKLLIFSSTTCPYCQKLAKDLKAWHSQPGNKEKVAVVVASLDGADADAGEEWKYLELKKGVNSRAARSYGISAVPAMFLINSEDNIIVSAPGSFDKLLKALEK
ncbi:MAG: thioredoxin family protein [Candidatus Omnitrophica bacterium]|nr:thioredoxin family protein [Candidatus Omnitrophota bacterium]